MQSSLSTIGLAALMRMAYAGQDLKPVAAALAERIDADPADAASMMDLSTILLLSGDRDEGLNWQQRALQLQRIYSRPHGSAKGPRVLAFCIAGDFMANTPIDFLLEGSNTDLHLGYVDDMGRLPADLPAHDVAFLAVGESPEAVDVLTGLRTSLANWPCQLLNGHPERIAALTRDGVSAMFEGDPHVISPAVARLDRDGLVAHEQVWPVIARPIGTHAGHGLAKLDDRTAVAAYLAEQTEPEFYLSPFVDYRSPDGLYRKQRVVFVEGRPFITHMAISEHWMVHYLSAGMTEDAAKRAEEAAFMEGFDAHFASRHAIAFASLCEKIGLDYFGIDCAETAEGRLLLFEADVAMIVHTLDPEPDFSYKKPVMHRMLAAFQDCLERHRTGS